jgi:hypothetical protein
MIGPTPIRRAGLDATTAGHQQHRDHGRRKSCTDLKYARRDLLPAFRRKRPPDCQHRNREQSRAKVLNRVCDQRYSRVARDQRNQQRAVQQPSQTPAQAARREHDVRHRSAGKFDGTKRQRQKQDR